MEEEKSGRRKRSAWKSLRDKAVIGLSRPLIRGVGCCSLETVQRMAIPLGKAMARVPMPRGDRIRRHLKIAFPDPEYDAAFRRKLYRDTWPELTQFFFETLWSPAFDNSRDLDRIEVADPERFQRTLDLTESNGRGLIIYTAHLGSPEVVGRWLLGTVDRPVLAVMGRGGMQGLAEAQLELRQNVGLKMVVRGEAGSTTLRHLKAGGIVVMLVDHNLKGPGVEIPVFGHPAHTLLAPARLALQSGAAVNTIFSLRRGRGRFAIMPDEPFIPPTMTREKSARFRQEAELALEYTRRIENAIRQNPEQYLWMHKRWRKRDESLPFPSSS